MGDIREVMRSQSLVDSMHELIENQKDVVNALDYTANNSPPSRVMLPVTGVAFMPGTIIGEPVMVGLGDDYYVERTSRQAKDILERRTLDLKRNATAVAAKGALIITSKSKDKPDAQKSKQRAKKPLAVSWKKGFLSSGPYAHDSQQDQNSTKIGNECTRSRHSGSPQEVNSKTLFEDSVAHEDPPTEEIEETPIMDIREWLDDSEREISVDVTDLGKVLGKPQLAATEVASSLQNVSRCVKGSADLDTIFDRLEEQEAKAEERGKGSHQLLGPSWKKGFLDGRSASRPEGSTINNRNVEKDQATKADSDIQSTSTESAQAFRDIVIEKSVTVGHNTLTRRTSAESAAAPSSVSRFKARRQGLQ